MAHIINNGSYRWQSLEFLSQNTFLNGKKLEKVVVDDESDVAVFELPNDLKLPNFPAKPSLNINLGDEVFIIGNPGLNGIIIRRGSVSDLDGVNNENSFFGIDIPVVPGDSGGPVVSMDFELLGLGYGNVSMGFGYVKRIGEFLKYL